MADVVPPDVRSRMMAGIRGKNTKPEMILRKGLHARGFRFQLHRKDLPGKPDLVFPKYRAVLFAQGCFWHGHDCHLFKWPSTRTEFWREKIGSNKMRDVRSNGSLLGLGWRIVTVWECALKGRTRLKNDVAIQMIGDWLQSGHATCSIEGMSGD